MSIGSKKRGANQSVAEDSISEIEIEIEMDSTKTK